MNLSPLLTLQFWFNVNPPPFTPVIDWSILLLMIALVLGGAVALYLRTQKKYEKMVRRAFMRAGLLGVIAGIIGLSFYGAAFERVPFLSMRFMWLIWVIWTGLEAWSIYRYVTIAIPAKQDIQAERDRINKWLPKKK